MILIFGCVRYGVRLVLHTHLIINIASLRPESSIVVSSRYLFTTLSYSHKSLICSFINYLCHIVPWYLIFMKNLSYILSPSYELCLGYYFLNSLKTPYIMSIKSCAINLHHLVLFGVSYSTPRCTHVHLIALYHDFMSIISSCHLHCYRCCLSLLLVTTC